VSNWLEKLLGISSRSSFVERPSFLIVVGFINALDVNIFVHAIRINIVIYFVNQS